MIVKKKLIKLILVLLGCLSIFIITLNVKEGKELKIKTRGINHIGLTVKNIEVTSQFFIENLNFIKVGGKPNYPAIFISDGTVTITLWQAIDPNSATSFDRKNNIGLHHVALNLNSFKDLNSIYQKLKDRPEILIEFPPELLGEGPAKHMIFYEPGGIRVELIVKP